MLLGFLVIGLVRIPRLNYLQQPETTINHFCSELQTGNSADAYNDFSSRFQSVVSVDTFQEKMGWYVCTYHTTMNNSKTTIGFHTIGMLDDTDLTANAVLAQENWGIWKIDQIGLFPSIPNPLTSGYYTGTCHNAGANLDANIDITFENVTQNQNGGFDI